MGKLDERGFLLVVVVPLGACAYLVLTLTPYLILRDTWERDNNGRLMRLAKKLESEDKAEALATAKEILDIIGERKLADPSLLNIKDEASVLVKASLDEQERVKEAAKEKEEKARLDELTKLEREARDAEARRKAEDDRQKQLAAESVRKKENAKRSAEADRIAFDDACAAADATKDRMEKIRYFSQYIAAHPNGSYTAQAKEWIYFFSRFDVYFKAWSVAGDLIAESKTISEPGDEKAIKALNVSSLAIEAKDFRQAKMQLEAAQEEYNKLKSKYGLDPRMRISTYNATLCGLFREYVNSLDAVVTHKEFLDAKTIASKIGLYTSERNLVVACVEDSPELRRMVQRHIEALDCLIRGLRPLTDSTFGRKD